MARRLEDIRERIRAALDPYKKQLEAGRPKDGGGLGGLIDSLVWRFRSQPSHHIDLLVQEACSELRGKDPDITEADIQAVISKYTAKAQKIAKEMAEYQRTGGLGGRE